MAHSNEVVFLRGKRLYLRPVLKEDTQYFMKWMNDQEVTQYLGHFLPSLEAEEEKYVENLLAQKDKSVTFMIVTNEGQPIGSMGIHDIHWKDRVATTGAVIGEKEFWGRGYGTEAKMLVLRYAFCTMNLRKICSGVLEFNKRSYAYLLKTGYRVEGRQVRQIFRKGRYWDKIVLGLFKKDFLPLWRKYHREHLR